MERDQLQLWRGEARGVFSKDFLEGVVTEPRKVNGSIWGRLG